MMLQAVMLAEKFEKNFAKFEAPARGARSGSRGPKS